MNIREKKITKGNPKETKTLKFSLKCNFGLTNRRKQRRQIFKNDKLLY